MTNLVLRLVLRRFGTGVIHEYQGIVGPFRRSRGRRLDVQGGGHLFRRLRGRGPWLSRTSFMPTELTAT